MKESKRSQTLKEESQTVELIKQSIVNIFDEENVYEGSDLTKTERDEFVDSLTFPQLELVGKWFDQLPKLSARLEWDCEECGTKNEQNLEGIQKFFLLFFLMKVCSIIITLTFN